MLNIAFCDMAPLASLLYPTAMKNRPVKFVSALIVILIFPLAILAQVKVASDANLATPAHPSAALDVFSNAKGFLPPRLTTTERNGITAPADGLVIFNTDEDCVNVYQGSVWQTYCLLRYSAACNCVEYLNNYNLPNETWISITPPGVDGVNCWDLNANGTLETSEDINNDGIGNALDCQGADGADGAVGATGAQGPPGIDGADGAVGATGATGAQGPPGADGAVGATGATGAQGPPGADGAVGATGATGAQGAQGDPGNSCWDLNGNGTLETAEDINNDGIGSALDCQGSDDDWYEVGTTSPPNAITDNQFTQGNVAIGLTTPAQQLHVAGNIRSDGRNYYFGASQRLLGDNSSALHYYNNHSTVTQFLMRDLQGDQYGRLYGSGNGTNFGLMDGNGQWIFLSSLGNSLSWRISNVEKMRMTLAGNLGIGTTTPSETLDVNGEARIRTIAAGAAADEVLVANATGVIRKIAQASLGLDHDFYEVGTTSPPNAITDNQFTQGNLGIGIPNPLQQLHVNGSIRTDGARVYLGPAQNIFGNGASDFNFTSNSAALVKLRLYDNANTFTGAVVGQSGGVNFGLNDRDSHWTFRSVHDQYLTMSINNSEKVRILLNGNMGVGTTGPSERLDVNGGARIRTLPAGTTADQVVTANGAGLLRKRPLSSFNDHDWYEIGSTNSPNNINDNQYTQGNVGIGQTTANYRLDVNGEITSRSANAFRLRGATRSVIHRNDGTRYYQLLTSTADGSWNTFRPYYVVLASGNVGIGNDAIYVQHADKHVGVGTVTPDHVVDIFDAYSSANQGATVRISGTGNYAGGYDYEAGPRLLLEVPSYTYSERMATGIYFNRVKENVEWFAGNPSEYVLAVNGDGFGIGRYLKTTGAHNNNASRGAYLKFYIDNGGDVGIGLNNPTYALQLPNNATNDVGRAQAFSWNTYSDGRLKSNRAPMKYGLKEIMALEPLAYDHHFSSYKEESYDIKVDPEYHRDFGFIAQDLIKLVPEAVQRPKDEVTELWGVDYGKLVPVLTKAVQEQQELIDVQNTKIETLEARLKAIEEKLRKQ